MADGAEPGLRHAPDARSRRTLGVAVRRLLASRAFAPVASLVIAVCLAGSGLQVARLAGWSPALFRPQRHDVVITGPGVGTPGAAAIQAEVLGAVASPGVYALPAGARVGDLVAAAGGLLADADAARVDQAAPLADGQEIYVPRVGEPLPTYLGGLVDLNTASATDLHDALGLSTALAQRIVDYRTAHGRFTAVSQLLLVPISRATYDRIKFLLTV
jgi:competence protein ComEA